MKKDEVGHNFLARLGKTRLRPGGRKATEWLIANGNFNQDKKVLEVACNMCTTAIGLAKKFGCSIEGVDLDENALEKAQNNITAQGLQDKIHVQRANAMRLPFADETFDIVINEAMLTMLPLQAKMKAIAEYYRVLKPGGVFLFDAATLGHKTIPLFKQAADAYRQHPETIRGLMNFNHPEIVKIIIDEVGLHITDKSVIGDWMKILVKKPG